MISAERFLKEQGLQPASADTGGLALSSEAQMRRKRHDTRDTLGVSGTAILLPQRIQMILTHAGKPHCDCWTLRLDLPAHCVSA